MIEGEMEGKKEVSAMRKGLLITLVLLIGLGLLLTSTSCTRKEAETPAEETATTPTTPPTPPPTTPAEAPPPADAFAESYDALTGLNSYRYSVLFLFEGEDEGEVVGGSVSIEGRVSGPDTQHLVWTDLETQEHFEVIRLGDKAWIRDEEDAWEEVPALVADGLLQAVLVFTPAYSWNNLYAEIPGTAEYVGKETINGISCSHYTSNYAGWGEGVFGGEVTEASGDVWIAEEGFPVRYAFTATGIDAESAEGSVEWTMELKDVNQPISIEPPM
jgi:hypothetical protein